MKHVQKLLVFIVFFLLLNPSGFALTVTDVSLPWPVMKNIPFTVTLTVDHEDGQDSIAILENKIAHFWQLKDGVAKKEFVLDKTHMFQIEQADFKFAKRIRPIPLWLSVLPPLIAILMALAFKEVYSSLFFGLFSGTFLIGLYHNGSIWEGLSRGLLSTVDTFFVDALKDRGHVSIIIFSMLIGGMVSIIHKNGGMKGLVDRLARYAKSPRSGQFITWALGLFIFFDDYANTLVVGNTMRPVTDRLKVSRAKLAYIVDSTAAPIASIAFVTTWIGAELSYIKEGITTIGIDQSAYAIFLSSLKYSFYPIFTLAFVLFLILKKRDFGPMLPIERHARKQKENIIDSARSAEAQHSSHWINGVFPVVVVVIGTIAGLLITGWDAEIWHSDLGAVKKISHIIGNADSYVALLWSSLLGTMVALTLSVSQGLLSLQNTMEALMDGFKSMLPAVMVLILAWSLAEITQLLHTATFISNALLNFKMAPWLVPALTFLIAAVVAFSTGSSWGTMAILYPLILPAGWLICQNSGLDHDASLSIFTNIVSSVLAGSVLGDHCSPISDTTIMSSLASGCDHIQHVRTQMPYALTVGAVSIFLGTIPAALGFPILPLFIIGLAVLYGIVVWRGKTVE